MNGRTTILYIHHGKGLGGAPISLITLIKGLDLKKFQPLVLFLFDSQAMQLFRDANIEVLGPVNLSDFSHTQVYWFHWYHMHHVIKALVQSTVSFFVALRLLHKLKPDLVHLNTSTLTAWGMAAKLLKIPVVWHIRESLADGYFGLRRWIIKKIIAHCATKIVPICQTDGRFWTPAKKQVLYNPVDTKRFTPAIAAADLPPATNYLLFVGGLSHQKGTDFMLDVFEQVRTSVAGVKLIIAGAFDKPATTSVRSWSPEKKYMTNAYKHYELLKDDIILTGPTTQIPALMQAASVVFFPAQVDHFARPIIEAGCMGKPIIASDLPQLREIVEHGKTGYLLSPKNTQAWVEVTVNLLNDQEKREAMGQENYHFCHNQFALTRYSQAIDTLYSDITNSRRNI